MKLLRKFADNTNAGSLANAMRRERFSFFCRLLASVPPPVRILDVGGTENFWEQMGFLSPGTPASAAAPGDLNIVLLNITAPEVKSGLVTSVAGNGCSMPQYADREFDIVFSNSVIEHVPEHGDQLRMAAEIRRVGKRYFVQTPNRYFPIEPHFLFPGFQFLPVAVRASLLQRLDLGWYSRTPDRGTARELVESIRLLNKSELRGLFPGAGIYHERFKGLTKSLIAYDGFAV